MGWVVFFFVLAILLFWWAIYAFKSQKNAKATFETRLQELGFLVCKQLEQDGMIMYIDDVHKKWLVRMNVIDDNPHIFKFSDLLEFEIFEDGDSVMKGRTGSAIVGGALFGVVGAVVGASRSRKIKSTCTTMQVIIRVNDLSYPQIIIPFIKSETQKNSFVYKMALDSAREFVSTLTYIQNNKSVVFEESTVPNDESEEDIEKSNEVSRLLELNIAGELSDAEYDAAVNKLFGIDETDQEELDEFLRLSELHDSGELTDEEFHVATEGLLKK